MPARTTNVINGTDLLLFIDATHVIGHSTTCSMTLSADMRDVSNKDSAGWKAVLPGQKNWTAQAEGLTVFSDTYNLKYMMDLIVNKTPVSLKLTTPNPTGDYTWAGSAYVTSVNMNGANEANSTFSVSFQGTAALTITDPLLGGG